MSDVIVQALLKLDPNNHDHWTANGQPRLDVVRELTGQPYLTRETVASAVPGFSRSNADLPAAQLAIDRGPGANDSESAIAAPAAPVRPVQAEMLRALQCKLADLKARRNDLTAEINSLEAQADSIIEESEQERIPNEQAVEFQKYLEAQKQVAHERAARLALLSSNNIDLQQLSRDLRDPVDSRRKRGI